MSQLAMTGDLPGQREHVARYLRIRAALRAEAERAAVTSAAPSGRSLLVRAAEYIDTWDAEAYDGLAGLF